MVSDIITELDRLVTQLKNNRELLGDDFCTEVVKAGEKFMENLSESVGKKILHKLHKAKTSKGQLEAIITVVPSALSVKNKRGRIPIQQASWHRVSVEYVGLLAREGVKYNVGGEGKRGGLLLVDPTSHNNKNILQLRSDLEGVDNPLECDTQYADVLKELWESGLLTADDITEYKLFYHSCRNTSQRRFEYLSSKCPEALKKPGNDGDVVFHTVIEHQKANNNAMQLFLRAALKHFPNELGLLFQQDDQGTTTFEVTISRIGKENTFSIIRQCIPPDTSLPILHHVIKHAPQYIGDFTFHYPHATYLKDEEGDKRTYFQVRIASGNATFAKDAVFLTHMSPDQIEMVDPVTDLYPFMVAASGDTSDLDAVFYLLRREPKLVYENHDHCGRKQGNRERRSSGSQKESQGRGRERQIKYDAERYENYRGTKMVLRGSPFR